MPLVSRPKRTRERKKLFYSVHREFGEAPVSRGGVYPCTSLVRAELPASYLHAQELI